MAANHQTPVEIILATAEHIPAITLIYAYHVLHGTGSFEETPPTDAQMLERFEAVKAGGYPYLVALLDGVVIGFASVGPYKTRSAYRFTVETTVYINQEYRQMGIGTQLLQALIKLCEQADYKQMMAVVGDSNNTSSIKLHKAAGFEVIGVAKAVGFKHGDWLDSVLMQRPL